MSTVLGYEITQAWLFAGWLSKSFSFISIS
jgi:hypothetical protein